MPKTGWNPVLIGLGLSMLGSLAFLAAARYSQGPRFIDFLWISLSCAGFAAGFLLRLLIAKLTAYPKAWSALVLSSASLIMHASLIARIEAQPVRRVTIVIWEMLGAATSICWAALALLWGISQATDILERHGGSARKRDREKDIKPRARMVLLSASGIAISGAMFAIAPLWRLLGLRINQWTLLGLLGVGLAAFVTGRLFRRFS
jgi:hypothetical protein